ncbi:MAG: metallophosphoesterase [Actinomycetota bacterium]|nr:metallophosphoesterase [Actinomycetota bacterium]MDA3012939.1 metallophosphoesterase [Actinomycetota bacterium]
MIFISDVHHNVKFLEKLPKDLGPVIILGDLINWIDYRNGEGIAKDVFGYENVMKLIELRKNHLFEKRKLLWKELYFSNPEQTQKKMQAAIEKQYIEVFESLKTLEVWFIPGNVDDLEILNSFESNKIKNVDNTIVETNFGRIGFAGGGVPTLINARGEISVKDFQLKLDKLSGVDIICTHAPPKVIPLMTDVVTNKIEQGWQPLVEFILENSPKLSLFGDVHQPKASNWYINKTRCINVGYFRATNRYLELSSLYI